MGVVAEAAPVHGAVYERSAQSEQNDATGFERIIHPADRLDPAAAQRMSLGRSDVTGKSGKMEGCHANPQVGSGVETRGEPSHS